MRAKRLLALLLIGVASACMFAAAAENTDVAVVVSENNHLGTITRAELRRVLAGERRSWVAGLPIKLMTRSPGTHERMVMLKLLGMSESEYKQYWIQQVFRGEAEAEPLTLPSVGMQMEALAVFPGGVTLVAVQDVKPGMKVIKVDGHLPGEEGYSLH